MDQLHVGKKDILCPDLYIDQWKDELKTGVENLEDVLGDQYKIENVLDDKYLGDVISVYCRNTKI